MEKYLRLYHTVKYLSAKQIFFRFFYHYWPLKIHISIPIIKRRAFFCYWQENEPENTIFCDNQFIFLNEKRDYTDQLWNDSSCEKLWLYHLHYFDYLNNQNRYLIEDWIRCNPPCIGVGWEPYPLSLRIVNWIKYALSSHELSENAQRSLYLQARALAKRAEHHLRGNHIFENYKTLCFAGLFFEGKEANQWFNQGINGLKKEINEQILPDGGHFELSPMYHSIVLNDLLELYQLFEIYQKPYPDEWKEKIKKMLYWLACMTHPDGDISFFNDAAFGVAKKNLSDIAIKLGIIQKKIITTEGITHLKNTGYLRLQKGKAVLLIDCASIGPDYLPGHAHADTLSFEFSLDQQRILVNSGTSTYKTGALRERQRSTAAHNTVEINGKNSSDVWSSFRVGKRAKPIDLAIIEKDEELMVKCSHDGYYPIIHTRTWRLTEHQLSIEDSFNQACDSVAHYYFAPELSVPNNKYINIICSAGNMLYKETSYYPYFGKQFKSNKIEIKNGKSIYILFNNNTILQ